MDNKSGCGCGTVLVVLLIVAVAGGVLDYVLPINYDRAARDLMVLTIPGSGSQTMTLFANALILGPEAATAVAQNPSVTITMSDSKKALKEMGMTSKDFVSLTNKVSSAGMIEEKFPMITTFESDWKMAKKIAKKYDGIDLDNLRRALKRK
jgi:hypothetical protein